MKKRWFRHWFKSLGGRLVLGTFLIHFLLIPVLFSAVFTIIDSALKEQFINEIRTISGLLANQIELIDPEQNPLAIERILDDLMLGGLTTYAELDLFNKRAIHSSISPLMNIALFQEDVYFGQHDDKTYFLSIPIFFKDYNMTSSLRLGFDEIPMQEKLYLVFKYTIFLLLVYAILGIALMVFLGNRLTLSIRRLRLISRQISDGQMDVHMDVKSQITDVADLVHDLEHMRGKLVDQTQRLEHIAHHDALTLLPNRVLFKDRLENAILSADRNSNPFAVLLMDLDQFKEINDTLGHPAGDEVLKQTAFRINAIKRASDTSARLGGDEFAMILPNTDAEGAKLVANKIYIELNKPYRVDGNIVFLGVSIGISLYPDHESNAKDLIRIADLAMYEAKHSGYTFLIYHENLDYQLKEQFNLSNDLRHGLEHAEFVLFYQPVLDLRNGAFCGVEALVRWQHPEQGLIVPDKFISVAERTGLIEPLTDQILCIATQQCKKMIDQLPEKNIKVAVNLSTKSLHDNTLPERFFDICQNTGCPPQLLKFEMTETAILRDTENVEQIIHKLKSKGCLISIDDFGTGYSSLSRLKRLPFDEIKIDKSFVQGITKDTDDLAIVKATIRMAHDLGLTVVAEGVEDLETFKLLKELDCDMAQGYLISYPLAEKEFVQWMGDTSSIESLSSFCKASLDTT